MVEKLRKLLRPLRGTPFHPQWFTRRGRKRMVALLRDIDPGSRILDIGCFDKWPSRFLMPACRYVGMDYLETASKWYKSIPDLYGDAADLPILSESVDVILLLDVLEHVPETQRVLEEARRILRINGILLMQIPFLYPIHDAPRDYTRLTYHGLAYRATRAGFQIESLEAVGHPVETGVLLINLATSKTLLSWVDRTRIAYPLLLLLPLTFLLNNLVARLVSFIGPMDNFMPSSYVLVLKKIPVGRTGGSR